MIALDVSKSMLAEDVAPNRLDRAKAEIVDLLGYLQGDQVGLIAFAGRATVIAPLTPDFSFLRLVLDGVGPHTIARGGTRLEEPIRKALGAGLQFSRHRHLHPGCRLRRSRAGVCLGRPFSRPTVTARSRSFAWAAPCCERPTAAW